GYRRRRVSPTTPSPRSRPARETPAPAGRRSRRWPARTLRLHPPPRARGCWRFRSSSSPPPWLDELGAGRPLHFNNLLLVEPDLVAVGVHDREGTVSPPLGRQRVRYLDPVLRNSSMIGVDVVHFEVDLDGAPAGGRPLRIACFARAGEHDLRPVQVIRDKVELSVLSHHPHHALEPELFRVELVQFVDGVHGDNR